MKRTIPNVKRNEKLDNLIIDNTVDIKYLKKIWIIVASFFTILLTIFSFFGWDKITSIEKYATDKVNKRLERSDSLIAMLDEKKIKEINDQIKEKEKEYKIILSNLDNLINENEEIQNKILLTMPINDITSREKGTNKLLPAFDNKFTLINFPKKVKNNTRLFIYLSLPSTIKTDTLTNINIDFLRKQSETNFTTLNFQSFKPKKGLNKLFIDIQVDNNIKKWKYNIWITLYSKKGIGYIKEYEISIE
ncbi:MAG: hypothetical protein V1779_08910 [bacterium]